MLSENSKEHIRSGKQRFVKLKVDKQQIYENFIPSRMFS